MQEAKKINHGTYKCGEGGQFFCQQPRSNDVAAGTCPTRPAPVWRSELSSLSPELRVCECMSVFVCDRGRSMKHKMI